MSYFPPYIDATGIHMPTYADRLEDLCSAYRSVFGQEAELSPAVPDLRSVLPFRSFAQKRNPTDRRACQSWAAKRV